MIPAATLTTSASTACARLLSVKASTAVVATLGSASLLIGATAAYAAWTVTGSHTVNASTAAVAPLTVSFTAPADLYPGAIKNVVVNVVNTNAFPIDISSVTWGTALPSDPSCGAGNLTLAGATGLSQRVLAGATASITLANAVTLNTNAPDACQSKSFQLTATVNGASATT